MVKYTHVKLTAKPNTWFKEGTEVFNYKAKYDEQKRVTVDEWNQAVIDQGICVRGIRVCEEDYEQGECLNCKVGEERIDGEWCHTDEFNVEYL